MNIKGQSFLTLKDFTPDQIAEFLDIADWLRDCKRKRVRVSGCEGKNIALIFEKTSTRTRCSFEVAAYDLGMGATYLDPKAPPRCSAACSTVSNTADSVRRLWRISPAIRAFRCGTA